MFFKIYLYKGKNIRLMIGKRVYCWVLLDILLDILLEEGAVGIKFRRAFCEPFC